jgi:hypothetical protein
MRSSRLGIASGLCALLAVATGCADGSAPTEPPTPQPDRTLAVQVGGAGGGTVTSQPAGIECRHDGGTCVAVFPHGTAVVLTGTAADRMAFTGWTQACTGSGVCTVTMDTDKTVAAEFDNPHLVEREIGPAGGSITSADGRLTLTFPAGALAAPATITVEAITAAAVDTAFKVLGAELGSAYRLGPAGLAFASPVATQYRMPQDPPADDEDYEIAIDLPYTEDGAAVAPLDSLAVTADADSAFFSVHGELRHFSTIVFARRPFTLTIKGVPFISSVGQAVTVGSFVDIDWPDARLVDVMGSDILSQSFEPTRVVFTFTVESQFASSHETYLCTQRDVARYRPFYMVMVRVKVSAAEFMTQTVRFFPRRDLICEAGKSATLSQPVGAGTQVTRGGLVGEAGQQTGVTGGTSSLYNFTYPGEGGGSVVLMLVYGGAGAIPGSNAPDPMRSFVIHRAFREHGTEQPFGGPIIDWTALFQTLEIDASRVCGGRVVLEIPADQGGILPGFDAEGRLSGSGRFTGETGGICQNFNITLNGEIEDD